MLVHRCTECGKLSINRIAADDDAETMLAIYQRSHRLGRRMRAEFEAAGIQTLTPADFTKVSDLLFGRN
jgi:hypothetical protein